MKIAIIGSPDTILGFKALGVKPYGIKTKEQGQKIIDKLRKNKKIGVILITEDWAIKLEQELKPLEQGALPALIRIPGSQGPTGEGKKSIKQIVERAVGSDILS